VVVDANVLYSIELTDLFLTFAAHRLVRVHWSSTILDEVRRNLAKRADLSPDAIAYRIDRMNRAVPGALDEAPEAPLRRCRSPSTTGTSSRSRCMSRPTASSRSTCVISQRVRVNPTASKPSIRTASRWLLPRATHRGPTPRCPTSIGAARVRQ
jgi:hypothetical protein